MPGKGLESIMVLNLARELTGAGSCGQWHRGQMKAFI